MKESKPWHKEKKMPMKNNSKKSRAWHAQDIGK